MGEAAEYFSKDFEWNDLRIRVENDPLLQYHLLPFEPSNSVPSVSPEADSDAWSRFHLRHSSGKFFKERRYLLKEFPELVSCKKYCKVLEVGCGNGSTVIPILRGNENIVIYACDCSTETLERAKEILNEAGIASLKDRFCPFYCDFSISKFPTWLACNSCRANTFQMQPSFTTPENDGSHATGSCALEESGCCIGGVDFLTLIFTLSAVPLQRMPASIRECFTVLKPGGLLLFRDYGLYDMTMLRFGQDQRVGFREYVRLDGTRSYFFCLNTLRDLFVNAGFVELELEYCCVRSLNRRNGKSMERVWVHGKFQKPVS
ncbi:tRNA N(3)-methylcytidine methyltransferase METTL6 [Benincasa hispida]|uniref:tRNA N(3)-methylcytidine methyltransferase METTL6 n=1 Tax=Benincasa hispida TaxID=102211 RepID=UPI001900B0C9|nr:tRNA N(3)-methylcytidine methyltransferase METTL6 [Benincasa hispida]